MIDTESKLSPMMAQWQACKLQAAGAILFFRLGDFYEAFHEDATLLAKELDVTLTQRQEIPMAGVPFHSGEGYIDKLVGKGYRVAIAEQMEDPRSVKGIVKREIVRIVTPGTLIQSSLLSDKSNNFLACIVQVGEVQGLSILDLTTTEFRAVEFDRLNELVDELYRLKPKEILLSGKWQKKYPAVVEEFQKQWGALVQSKEDWHFEHSHACQVLLRHFQVHSLDGFGLNQKIAAISASGAILHYVHEELRLSIDHIKSIRSHSDDQYMQIDRATQKHLELFESVHQEGRSQTLLDVIDHTQTPMGGRLLKQWLTHPLLEIKAIQERQEGVQIFIESADFRGKIEQQLRCIQDLQRLMMRIETLCATPRDLGALRESLQAIQPISTLLGDRFVRIRTQLHDVSPLVELLNESLVETPPLRLNEGGVFKEGFNQELDALLRLQENSQTWVANYQVQLREKTQIKTLKLGYTKAFGYYIEVSRGQAEKTPEFFQRKQTLVNAERFITQELKEFEYQILHAEEQLSALELQLFTDLRKHLATYSTQVYQIAEGIAHLDCLFSLGLAAKKYNYVCPRMDESGVFEIKQGRHPVVEACLKSDTYIPNDLVLDGKKERLHIITGPNMAGKSTFIRQAALIAIMAQIGSYIPAKEAHIGIIDKVFSRIGASDDLSKGQSTFMVEMTETANILNNATSQSLVILDEIGRGTSTYDGISIAWAVAEYLLTEPKQQAKTLFATHYWELTELEMLIPGAVNYHVAVHEGDQGIIFLRKIVRGSTDKSYGIHVAKLAGLPDSALKRAQEMLKKLEKKEIRQPPRKEPKEVQLSLFSLEPKNPLLEALKTLDPHQLTPMQALQKLVEWKEQFL